MISCAECLYSEIIVAKGTEFTLLNPYGEDVPKVQEVSIYECKRYPPITDGWPRVLAEHWCGEFTRPENDT